MRSSRVHIRAFLFVLGAALCNAQLNVTYVSWTPSSTSLVSTTYWTCQGAGCSVEGRFTVDHVCSSYSLAIDVLATDYSLGQPNEDVKVLLNSNQVARCKDLGSDCTPGMATYAGCYSSDVSNQFVSTMFAPALQTLRFNLGVDVNCGSVYGKSGYYLGARVRWTCSGFRSRPPTTSKPSFNPTTKRPTWNPTTLSPTLRPTRRPTNDPTTRSPTRRPTLRPTWNPTTKRPTWNPTTSRPTLSPTHSPTCAPAQPFPAGLVNGMARGINVFTDRMGDALILDMSSTQRPVRTAILDGRCPFILPDVVERASSSTSSSSSLSSTSMSGIYSTYDNFVSDLSGKIGRRIGKSTSRTTTAYGSGSLLRSQAESFFSTHDATIYTFSYQKTLVTVALKGVTSWKFDPSFVLDLNLLPRQFDTTDIPLYQTFWAKYGTHIFTSGNLGGRFEGASATDKCSLQKWGYTSRSVQTCIGARFQVKVFNVGPQVCNINSNGRTFSHALERILSATWVEISGGSIATFQDAIQSFAVGSYNMNGAFQAWVNSLEVKSSAYVGGSVVAIPSVVLTLLDRNLAPFSTITDMRSRMNALDQAYWHFLGNQGRVNPSVTCSITCPLFGRSTSSSIGGYRVRCGCACQRVVNLSSSCCDTSALYDPFFSSDAPVRFSMRGSFSSLLSPVAVLVAVLVVLA